MTRDDIIRMAREAGFSDASQIKLNVEWTCVESEIKHFAALVAAAEREACAKIVDEMAGKDRLSNYFQVAAIAIRARGQQ